jgi:hypothetical protein
LCVKWPPFCGCAAGEPPASRSCPNLMAVSTLRKQRHSRLRCGPRRCWRRKALSRPGSSRLSIEARRRHSETLANALRTAHSCATSTPTQPRVAVRHNPLLASSNSPAYAAVATKSDAVIQPSARTGCQLRGGAAAEQQLRFCVPLQRNATSQPTAVLPLPLLQRQHRLRWTSSASDSRQAPTLGRSCRALAPTMGATPWPLPR